MLGTAGRVSYLSVRTRMKRARYVPAYIPYTKSMLTPASFSFGIFLQLRMVAKTTSYFGEHQSITARVGATVDRNLRTNGGPGCSSLEGFLQENGV